MIALAVTALLPALSSGFVVPHARCAGRHFLRSTSISLVDSAAVQTVMDAVPLVPLVGNPMVTDPHWDPHTLENLGPDLFNTCVVAAVGLMGAYVTQGTTDTSSRSENEPWRTLEPGMFADEDDEDEEFFRSLK